MFKKKTSLGVGKILFKNDCADLYYKFLLGSNFITKKYPKTLIEPKENNIRQYSSVRSEL